MPLCRERCYLEDRNIRLATVLYCLAMVLNTSSSLTNAIASIGLSLDTYLNNMLANWAPLACPRRRISRALRTASVSDESGVIWMSAACTCRQQSKLTNNKIL